MGRSILYLGDSGVGKSTSLRTLDPKETFIIAPNRKELPFPGSEENYTEFDVQTFKGNFKMYNDIVKVGNLVGVINSKLPHIKNIVIEDLSHFYTHSTLDNKFLALDDWSKWNKFGASVFNALLKHVTLYRSDLTLIVLQHTEVKGNGTIGDKTIGKVLTKIQIPSWFTVVIHGMTQSRDDKEHYLCLTNKQGTFLAKSPPGMFKELFVRNDMAEILSDMKAYYSGKARGEVDFI